VVGLAAEHHPIEGLQMLAAFFQRLDAAVEDDLEVRVIPFELRGDVVAQRWHVTVLLG